MGKFQSDKITYSKLQSRATYDDSKYKHSLYLYYEPVNSKVTVRITIKKHLN